MADAKLRQIIAKLEGKLKPMHDEIDSLRERLELASLDKELAEEQVAVLQAELSSVRQELQQALQQLEDSKASEEIIEQLTAKNLDLSAKVSMLSQQVADLEVLKELSDELEESHLLKERELNAVITHLESQIKTATSKLKAAELQAADLKLALAKPAPENQHVDIEGLQRQLDVARLDLKHTKLDLYACKLDLQAAQSDIYTALASRTQARVFFKLKFLASADPTLENKVLEWFDQLKYQNMTAERIKTQAIDLAARPWPNLEVYWPQALVYLRDMGGPKFEGTPELSSLAGALEDPVNARLIAVRVEEPQEPKEPEERLQDEMRIKIHLLEAKVSKARELAGHVSRLEQQVSEQSVETARLKETIDDQSRELAIKIAEINKLNDRPVSLDAVTFRAKLSVLNETINHLMTTPSTLDLPSLDYKPNVRSKLCGHPAIRKLVGADFEVKKIEPFKWRPHSEKPGWAAAEQARTLAEINSLSKSPCR